MSKTLLTNYPSLDSKLKAIVEAISISAVKIEDKIRYANLLNLQGNHEKKNTSGDVQKKLDIVSNEIMIDHLIQSGGCNMLISEENKDPIYVPKEKKGTYLVAFDPLDGSSNIDCNAPIGTIFSVCENKKDKVLLKGESIIIAGYVLYGPATELIIAVNNKVDRYVLNLSKQFIYAETIHLKGRSKKIYSINESNASNWNTDIKHYINHYKQVPYTARYIGSMVGDVHRTLLYGGMFAYPADKKNANGKLRLLYECYPMAKIMECAGGKAIVGNMSKQRILDVEPKSLHQRSSILLGSTEEISIYEAILRTLILQPQPLISPKLISPKLIPSKL